MDMNTAMDPEAPQARVVYDLLHVVDRVGLSGYGLLLPEDQGRLLPENAMNPKTL